MSELQLGLIVAGIAIVLVVYGFNRYQERLFRRRMERKFQEPRPADVLLRGEPESSPAQARVEPHVGSAAAIDGEQPAPAAMEAPVAVETAASAGDDAQPFVATAPVRTAAAGGAASIDYVCHVEAAEPIAQAPLAAFIKSTGMLGKPVLLRGWSIRGNEWVELPCPSEVPLVRLHAALQLADRSGPVNRVQLSTMRDLVYQLAEQVGVSCDCPDIDTAAQLAVDLDKFCARVDISIGCNLVPNGSAGLSGTKVRGLLESAGFALEPNGRFTLRSEDGALLMSAENIEEAPLTAERLRASPIAGLIFTMDVPKVPASARVFDRMMDIGRHLAQTLDATLVDDNRAPLTEAGLKLIRQQLRSVQAAMEAQGISAGSATAARLFS